MLTINVLANSENLIFFSLPPGKPNLCQECQVGEDKRDRVKLKPYKGNTCWNSVFDRIRRVIGPLHVEALKKERGDEEICSWRRKEQAKHEESLPVITDQMTTEQGKQFLKNLGVSQAFGIVSNEESVKKLETPELLEGRPSLIPFLKEFIKENQHKNMYDFLLEKKFKRWNEINTEFLLNFKIEPKKMFETEMTLQQGYPKREWEKISLVDKAPILDGFARKVTAEKYGLKLSTWTPQQSIEELAKVMKLEGVLAVGGAFGQSAYIDQPCEYKKLCGQTLYAWQTNAQRHSQSFSGHTVLLVGANTTKNEVYFIDPLTGSDPENPTSQTVFAMSYKNLTKHVADMHGRWQSHSSLVVGYAYHGNFNIRLK